MDNELMSLSFSMEANKGVYALLLGSGISHSAGILTGWGILNELCRRVMKVKEEDHENPIEWYKNYFGKDPSYDEVIEMLAKTSSERLGLLAEFFEPKEGEEDYVKKPTKAHREIAKLVQDGYIKVIVTTNFDRLMEQALDELNVQYQTLYDESDIEGRKPLTHANCTVLKIHGDYRDTRFKNVEDELATYPTALSNLLKQIFDEYGIITSGWSAEWDTALRDTIKSVKGRRYSWYWHSFNEKLGGQAEELLKFRDGIKIVDNGGADRFFSLLADNVESISKLKKSSLDNIQVKINKLKKFITNDLEIELREMVTEETQKLVLFMDSLDYDADVTSENLNLSIDRIKVETRTLATMLAILSYYAKHEKHESLIIETIERLTTATRVGGTVVFLAMSRIPAIVGFYSAGISSVMRNNYKFLNRLFTSIRVKPIHYYQERFLEFSLPRELNDTFRFINSTFNSRHPFEQKFMHPYICEIYNESKLIFNETETTEYYDIFELLRCMKHYHLDIKRNACGIFASKYPSTHLEYFLRTGAENGKSWDVLELFEDSAESCLEALKKLSEALGRMSIDFEIYRLLNSYKTVVES
ncbi:SIR2 family protein [Bacillus bombysepticus]